jgi:hypothetical protein
MTSTIYPNNIDITYPIAGQDNDTQGFRTNFTNIKNNFVTAANEITALQSNTAGLASSISTIQNNITNVVHSNATPVSSSSIGTAGSIAYDAAHLYVCVAANTWVRTSLSTF